MKQDFDTCELKAELERALGFRLTSLKRLAGGCALNFKAVREGDGYALFVKCSPPKRREHFGHLVRHLSDLRGSRAVRRVFEKECPPTFRGYDVLCLEWCSGERRFPDTLSDDELRNFLDDYLAFSDAMQKTSMTRARLPLGQMREAILANCRGLGGRIIRRLVEELAPSADVEYLPERVRIIHGDFHPGNFIFENGRVTGFLDLEEFRTGYPAEDIVRYFVFAADHLPLHDILRRRYRGTMRQFSKAVAHMPYPRGDWLLAVGGNWLLRVLRASPGRPIGFFHALNLAFRAKLYRRMMRMIGDI